MTLVDDLLIFLRVAAGMFLLLSLWVFIQDFIRRRSGCHNPRKDVLEFMLHGCGGGCGGSGACHAGDADEPKYSQNEVHHETH